MASCSGVRNRIFESGTFGSTLVWLHEQWTAHDLWNANDENCVALTDAVDASDDGGPFQVANALEISFVPNEHGGSQHAAVIKTFNEKIRDRYPGLSIPRPPDLALGASGLIEDGNKTVLWSIDTRPLPGNHRPDHEADPHIAVMFHERFVEFNHRRNRALRVFGSIEPPKPFWNHCYGQGVVDVIEVDMIREGDTFTLTIDVANVDEDPATLSMSAFQLDGPFELRSVSWDGIDHHDDDFTLPSDTSKLVTHHGILVFESSHFDQISLVEYVQRAGSVFLAAVNGQTNPAIKPRVNPGG